MCDFVFLFPVMTRGTHVALMKWDSRLRDDSIASDCKPPQRLPAALFNKFVLFRRSL